jgi:hypothetical protein
MADARFSPALDRLLAILFVLAIGVPLAGTVLGVDRDQTDEENRAAATPPPRPRDLASLQAWPDAFTKYFADNFAFRADLVRWQARLRVGVLRSSPTPDVLLGRDGWLFYGTDGAIQDYSGDRAFTPGELRQWRDTLQHTHDWLRRRGIRFVFLLAPDKHWIYPEHMPGGIGRSGVTSRMDQLVVYLRNHSSVAVVDARPALIEARRSDRLFHLTDTHWNDVGAFVAYQQVMMALGPGDDGLRPRPRAELERRVIPRTGFDLARMLGLGRVWVEDDLQLEPPGGRRARVVEPARASRALMDARVVTEGPAGAPRAVVFRDSFGSAMIPFLAEHFSRAVYVWQNDFDPALVANERPAVVIQEWVGRHLYTVSPYDGVAAAAPSGQQ